MNGGIVFCRDFLDQARVGVVYFLMLKKSEALVKISARNEQKDQANRLLGC